MGEIMDPLVAAIVEQMHAGLSVTFSPCVSPSTGDLLSVKVEAMRRVDDIPFSHYLVVDVDRLGGMADQAGAVADAVAGACEPVQRAAERREAREPTFVRREPHGAGDGSTWPDAMGLADALAARAETELA